MNIFPHVSGNMLSVYVADVNSSLVEPNSACMGLINV